MANTWICTVSPASLSPRVPDDVTVLSHMESEDLSEALTEKYKLEKNTQQFLARDNTLESQIQF